MTAPGLIASYPLIPGPIPAVSATATPTYYLEDRGDPGYAGITTIIPRGGSGRPFNYSSPMTYYVGYSYNDLLAIEAQRARQRFDRRSFKPLATDDVTVTSATSADSSLTKSYVWPVSGLTEGGSRALTQIEQDANPIDIGLPVSRIYHNLYYTGGNSYHTTTPLTPAYTGTNTQIMPRRYRFMTDTGKLQMLRYNILGASQSGARVIVDGRPFSIRPTAAAGTIDWLTLVFGDNQPREVEIFTWALVGNITWQPLTDVWRTPVGSTSSPQPVTYTLSASDGTIVWNDAGSAGGLQEEVIHAEYDTFQGTEYNVLDCIAGTGWINRVASGYQNPNNNFVDRMGAMLKCNPDLLDHPTGAANDISYRNQFGGGTTPTDAQIIAACRTVWLAYRAQNPKGRIMYGIGITSPYFQAWVPQMRTLANSLLAACQDIGVYVIDNTGWLTGTGNTQNLKGDGNCDKFVGNDNAHPTAPGAQYLRRRWAAARRKVMTDDGTLINTIITI